MYFNDQAMYFSYLLKFLFKISSKGPNNLLKLSLSIDTTLSSPLFYNNT